jgi:hypothetical protein
MRISVTGWSVGGSPPPPVLSDPQPEKSSRETGRRRSRWRWIALIVVVWDVHPMGWESAGNDEC